MTQPSNRAVTPALDQRPKRVNDCYLVLLAFFVKLTPMVLLLACVALDCPTPTGWSDAPHSRRLSGMT